ncbi:unnamed protein product [Porites lobata]|uniref:Uncharacterized protein n=1 Tax=Porites lobata TaxID=104759 RepID=A0ABN8PSR8_9CNID|nr:unnamed protein product [Porites lobata]
MALKLATGFLVFSLSLAFVSSKTEDQNAELHDRKGSHKCHTVSFPVKGNPIGSADRDRLQKIRTPELSWIQVLSIVKVGPGHFQSLGRVIHLKHLKELLEKQNNVNFDATRSNMGNLVSQLDILADTLYVEGKIHFYGVKVVKIYVREITATYGSQAYFYSPNWKEEYSRRVITGKNGEDGKKGIDGTKVYIYADVVNGIFGITSRGGDGKKGQDGGNGAAGRDSGHRKPDRSSNLCKRVGPCVHYSWPGYRGVRGPKGGDGGDAGKPGDGGSAGVVIFRARKINGEVTIGTCAGKGAAAARNGRGGKGGAGGLGGRGRRCYDFNGYPNFWQKFCSDDGATGRAPRGSHGSSGAPGKTPKKPGKDGEVGVQYINMGKISDRKRNELDSKTKKSYPLAVINIIRREAEDLLLSNSNDKKGRDSLMFILSLTNERSDLKTLKKDVQQKLVFLGQEGYDIFGKNDMFAPRVKWQSLEKSVEEIKTAAESYENAFNDIISTIEKEQNFKKIASRMSSVVGLHVNAEKKRLEEAKLIAESEKTTYVKSIEYLEEQMSSIIQEVTSELPGVYKKAKFNSQNLIGMLQGLVGFAAAGAAKDPFAFIDQTLALAEESSQRCHLKSLDSYLGSIKQWLTFGKHYKPLVDSSELDFDQMNVSSVPQIMQANLEINKEKFASELVCLLDDDSLPQDVAVFKQLLESFFIAGAARIDLIAEIMNLDNDIGGYNFDIPLLDQTEQAIKEATTTKGAPITKELQQMFMDNLLSSYRELERSFMKKVYELYKAFKFRTLWEGNNPLASFRRVASESAKGTGRLNGVVQLTGVLRKFQKLKDKANKCFTFNKYTTDIHRWSFNSVKDKKMFEDLASKGYTRFTINIDQSCEKCYNMRLLKETNGFHNHSTLLTMTRRWLQSSLKMCAFDERIKWFRIYTELLGKEDQPDTVPQKIYLKLRHLSGSFFRVPVEKSDENPIKQYYQPVASYRTIKFNRFTLSNVEECKKRKGKNTESYCVSEDDSRWVAMCNHALNKRGSHSKDALLGMEECQSPFGIYELKIPIDNKLACDTNRITTTNCKDLDLTRFTQMNVWTHYVFWDGEYPKGPDDIVCRKSQQKKRNETATAYQESNFILDTGEYF